MNAPCRILHGTSSSILHCVAGYTVCDTHGMDIRSRIRQVLAEHPDWTPSGISLKAGLSNSMLGKFLNPDGPGGIKSMTTDRLEAVAKALDVNPRWLMFGDYPKKVDPKIAYIWDRIPPTRQDQALAILETFAEDGDGTNG